MDAVLFRPKPDASHELQHPRQAYPANRELRRRDTPKHSWEMSPWSVLIVPGGLLCLANSASCRLRAWMVRRHFCRRLLGFSGRAISIRPASKAETRQLRRVWSPQTGTHRLRIGGKVISKRPPPLQIRHHHQCARQGSIRVKPSIWAKSLVLRVTSDMRAASAMAAIWASSLLMGWPACFRWARTKA